uniref:Uncharacterized protein n=1 Tax=Rhizophora mucronata TaxID=61149 RepID=A0A2P2R4P2_RHIMU
MAKLSVICGSNIKPLLLFSFQISATTSSLPRNWILT